MEEDIFAEISLMNTKKTYSKPFKKLLRTSATANNVKKILKPAENDIELGKPLTTKVALEYLLNGKLKTEVCRYCLKIMPGLSELDQVMQIAGTGALYKVTIRQMIACFYPYKANEDQNFPEKICQRCVDKAISAYLFTQQCEQAERALLNCLDDMHEKLEKLDPIDRPKKRGRQKLNPNYNVLYAEHKKVIDYAEPIRNIINVQAESLTTEPDWNELECKKCWQVLPNVEALLNHEKLHPKSMWYHCRLCGKSFVKHIQLKKHYNQVHVLGKKSGLEADKNFRCNECGNVSENYVQHLQHIEKHKFKTMMKHLIEKKTDRLCMICLNKSTDLVELDKTVCIHGGYPELVGDTSLYRVLASTLPDQKSCKYQELYVPHKANIMTITKRKGENIESVPNIDKKKLQYVLSLPTVVSKNRFNTDDFYYYVLCEPQTDIENNIDTDSKIVEITDKEPNDYNNDKAEEISHAQGRIDVVGNSDRRDKLGSCKLSVNDNRHFDPDVILTDDNVSVDLIANTNDIDLNNVKVQIDLPEKSNLEINTLMYAESKDLIDTCPAVYKLNKETMNLISHNDTVEETCNVEDNIILHEQPTDFYPNLGDTTIQPCFEKQKTDTFNFSNPIILEANANTKLNVDVRYILNYSNLSSRTYNQEIHDVKPMREENQEKSNLKWVFSKARGKLDLVDVNRNMTEDIDQIKINKDCKLCWVFKHLDKCGYCQKPMTKAPSITENNQYKDIYDNFSNNNIQSPTENDIKNIKATNKSINVNEPEIDNIWKCDVCLTNNNTDRFYCYCCESKKYSENGNCKVTFGNNKTFAATLKQESEKEQIPNKEIIDVDKEIELTTNDTVPFIKHEEVPTMDFKMINNEDTQSMDVEMDTDHYIADTPARNDEQMDFEENLDIPNIVQSFELPLNATSTSPYSMTNVQFNIGSNPDGRTNRKIKRPLRNVSKAFHK